jgi:hypothetical protein
MLPDRHCAATLDPHPPIARMNEGDHLTFGYDPMIWRVIQVETVNGMPAYRIEPDNEANDARHRRLKAQARKAKR